MTMKPSKAAENFANALNNALLDAYKDANHATLDLLGNPDALKLVSRLLDGVAPNHNMLVVRHLSGDLAGFTVRVAGPTLPHTTCPAGEDTE